MHKRMIRDFQKNYEAPLLEEKKKILEDIRQFKKPIDHTKLHRHMEEYRDFKVQLKVKGQEVKKKI
jgi:hypothetical protein